MTEQEQFLETIQKILKPIEPSNNPPKGISAKQMLDKMQDFVDGAEIKGQKVNKMASDYISTYNPSEEMVDYIESEIRRMFNEYISSFNR